MQVYFEVISMYDFLKIGEYLFGAFLIVLKTFMSLMTPFFLY